MEKKGTESLSCYTIGHSNIETYQFIRLLEMHKIDLIVDVRSYPYSKYVPNFNKEELRSSLAEGNISYLFMGDKIGGKYNDPDLLFSDGGVCYSKVSQTPEFIDGIQTVIEEIKKGKTLAIMCSEKDPFDCHRFLLVSHELEKKNVMVKHILGNGDVILNDALGDKLINHCKIDYQKTEWFGQGKSKEEALEEAYVERNKEIVGASR